MRIYCHRLPGEWYPERDNWEDCYDDIPDKNLCYPEGQDEKESDINIIWRTDSPDYNYDNRIVVCIMNDGTLRRLYAENNYRCKGFSNNSSYPERGIVEGVQYWCDFFEFREFVEKTGGDEISRGLVW